MAHAKVLSINMTGATTKVKRLKNNSGLGRFAAMEAGRLMNKYVPKLNGFLREYQVRPWAVLYTVPYAAYQYYGEGFHHSQPFATAHWDKNLRAEILAEALTKYLKR